MMLFLPTQEQGMPSILLCLLQYLFFRTIQFLSQRPFTSLVRSILRYLDIFKLLKMKLFSRLLPQGVHFLHKRELLILCVYFVCWYFSEFVYILRVFWQSFLNLLYKGSYHPQIRILLLPGKVVSLINLKTHCTILLGFTCCGLKYKVT